MDEDVKTLKDYLIFTVPHVTVLAGAVLGILLILGVSTYTALAIFAILYGSMLFILGLVVFPHLSRLLVYRLFVVLSIMLILSGILLLLNK